MNYKKSMEAFMSILENYEPKVALKFFEEICAIPHGSRNTKEISDYCVKFAKDRNLNVQQDEINNVIITKEATPGYEEAEAIIIQGHMDMVCEKTDDSDFDFITDGLNLETDGTYLWAKNTTLGGDDGVALAIAMAILDADNIPHPKLEVVFTVDEEIGLIGAQAIDLSNLTGKMLINIDSTSDEEILTSCAGGTFLDGFIPVTRETELGTIYELELKGLQGGHSGTQIHLERGNSNVLLGRLLNSVKENSSIISVSGGNAANVIPNLSKATVLVSGAETEDFKKNLANAFDALKQELSLAEPNIALLSQSDETSEQQVLTEDSQRLLIHLLMNIPNGIDHMSVAIPGLVETSSNMGVFILTENQIELKYSIRSSVESAKQFLANRVSTFIEILGGRVEENGGYPGWAYRMDSPLRERAIEVYQTLFGSEPKIGAIHAGLECGLFAAKINDLDCISIGPNLQYIHSVNEKLEINSLNKIWTLVLGILAKK